MAVLAESRYSLSVLLSFSPETEIPVFGPSLALCLTSDFRSQNMTVTMTTHNRRSFMIFKYLILILRAQHTRNNKFSPEEIN